MEPISAAVGLANVAGSFLGGRKSRKAAKRQAAEMARIAGLYDKAYGDLGNYYGKFGEPSVDLFQRLQDLITGEDYSSFRESPSYQFSVDEGLRAVQRAGAMPGGTGRYSGATLKGLQQRGQNLADQEFGSYLDRLSALFDTSYQAGQNQLNMPLNALNRTSPLMLDAQRIRSEGSMAGLQGLLGGLGGLGNMITGGQSLGNMSGFQYGLGGFGGIPFGGFS